LISESATVALIDADSFQVTQGSERFGCRVGVPEYTPPELQGMSLASVVRTPNQDAFGLAIVIFQLLFMGRHPFVGSVRRGEVPSLHEAIKAFRFAYTDKRDVGMDQPPGTPSLADFPSDVANSFEAAFSKELSGTRPTAFHWIELLGKLESSLIQCPHNQLHYYSNAASECPWCAMDAELGTQLFIPYFPAAEISIHPFDPGTQGFNLVILWGQIKAIQMPDQARLGPPLTTTEPPSPTRLAKAILWRRNVARILRVVGVGGAIWAIVTAPELTFLWLMVGAFVTFGMPHYLGNTSLEPLKNRYIAAAVKWQNALGAWYKRLGVPDFEDLQRSLEEAKKEYECLARLEKSKVDEYQAKRRQHQLHAFLDNFEIARSKIRGIGPAKEAALASFGIETAADVISTKLVGVPGVGPSISNALIEWRQSIERRFSYNPLPNDVDKQELGRIRAAIASRGALLRRTLISGPQNLGRIVARAKAIATAPDSTLNLIHAELSQAKADLQRLAVPVPALPASAVTASASASSASQLPPGGHTASSATSPLPSHGGVSGQSCPRCGSAMIRRIARRGRFAGHPFWGCSRYPQCKGTRN
jgi:DNA-binding helix-hairpin-helix protein with protein kinase domain